MLKSQKSLFGKEKLNYRRWNRLLMILINNLKVKPPTIEWNESDVPLRPKMEAEGIKLLESHFRKSQCYLEYGGGGSTVLAAHSGVPKIHCIEGDAKFLQAVKKKVESLYPSIVINTHHADLGSTKEWGYPDDPFMIHTWPRYCICGWDVLFRVGDSPDLILVDGRFRVSSFLASLMMAKKGTVILFDDYYTRPEYHVVEEYLAPTSRAGRMAEFITKEESPWPCALLNLINSSSDPL
jgi:hypothetical protein